MKHNEFAKAQKLIEERIDYLSRKKNNRTLWIGVLLILIPIASQIIFLDGESMQDYSYLHPGKRSLVYVLGCLGVLMFMVSLIFVLPIHFFSKTRNEEVAKAKSELIRKLKNKDVSYKDFEKEVLEKEVFIYFNT
jgi:hypothetical protein